MGNKLLHNAPAYRNAIMKIKMRGVQRVGEAWGPHNHIPGLCHPKLGASLAQNKKSDYRTRLPD